MDVIGSEQLQQTSKWTLAPTLLKTLFFPIFVPYLIYQFLGYLKEQKYRDCLPGKIVVITGASSGLGEQLAHTFYKAGCKLILCARRKDELDRVRSELLATCSQKTVYPPIVFPLNVADLESMSQKVAQILEIYGYIDILINNAGLSVRSSCLECVDDVDIKLMMVNYFGTVKLTKCLLPSMLARKEGRIVCIGSVQGKFSLPNRSSYAASKHALQAFCDSLRAEVYDSNIKVTLISPGYIKTNLSNNALTGSGKLYGKLDDTTAKGTSPEEMSRLILKAILRDKKDVVIAGLAPKLAIWLRSLLPEIYFAIMARRARKERSIEEKTD